jgi:centrosomal CEP192-like protein/HYDIN/CFA65/VesB family protein
VVGQPSRKLSRRREASESALAARFSFRSIVFLVVIFLGLLNLGGCGAYSGAPASFQAQTDSGSGSSGITGAVATQISQATPAPLEALPSSVAFGNVISGVAYAQAVALTNVGAADLTLTQVAVSGNGFDVSGISLPVTLAAGQSASISVTFESATPGSASGALIIASDAGGSPMMIALSATVGAPAVQLSASSSTVSFGSTSVGAATTQIVTLTNTGNSAVNIASIAAAGDGFAVSSAGNVTLAPNQSINIAVNFNPNAAGIATGNLIVFSNAPAVQVGLFGNGAASSQYSVAVSWSPSVSTVVGYYVYRGIGANAQLSKLSGAIVSTTAYQDANVASGQTYTYAVTAVDSNNNESALSTSASVTIP